MMLFQLLCSRSLTSLLISICVFLSGCDTSETAVERGITPDTPGAASAPPGLALTRSQLRSAFSREILDNNWKTLKTVCNTEVYLEFISPDTPFQSFEAFLEATPPPKTQYETFLKSQDVKQEEQDIAIIHKLTLTTLKSKALKYHGTPDTIANAPLENLLASPEVIAWMQLRFRDQNGKFDSFGWVQFVISHRGFANKLHAETQSKLHSLFETEGKSLGILQFALEDPITTGHLINVFTDVEIFIKWVNGDFDDK